MHLPHTPRRFRLAAILVLLSFLATVGFFPGNSALPASAASPYCTGIEGKKGVSAQQVIEVRIKAKSRGTVYLCTKKGKRYVRNNRGYTAYLGYNGTTTNKREGDGKTPKGIFWMRGGFGTKGNPGLPQKWTKTKRGYVWDDRSNSKYYNTMRTSGRGEKLYRSDVYEYAQVIGYNEKRTPGKGSAIFLHKKKGSNTAGCVALAESELLKTMRWQKSLSVQIVIH